MTPKPVTIAVDETRRVSGLLQHPRGARACYVLAHGAGAGMTHPFMTRDRRWACRARHRDASLSVPLHGAGRQAPRCAEACASHGARRGGGSGADSCPSLPSIAGGKSFGGRMTSQAQAEAPLARVRGLAFLGFPLHAAGRPSEERAAHLFEVQIPMLFLQGTRDALADIALMRKLAKALGKRATLVAIEDGDHSFHVPARTGRNDAESEPSCWTRSPVGSKTCPRSKSRCSSLFGASRYAPFGASKARRR